MPNSLKYILLVILSGIFYPALAQRDTTLTQEVEVVKSFKPTISDANKINDMPKPDQTEHQKPKFNYNIYSQPIFSTFSVNPLKAAAIEEDRKPDSGYGLVRAGLGNYYKPYGEFFLDHLTSKRTIFGIHGKHLSSFGKIKLEGGNKVDAPFAKNDAEVYINHLFSKSVLSLNFDLNRDGFDYYGYPKDSIPTILRASNQDINYWGKHQAFTRAGMNISLSNPSLELKDNDFSFNLRYYYFGTKTNQTEHYGKLSVKAQHQFDKGTGILEAGFVYSQADQIFNRVTLDTAKRSQTWLFANPSFVIGNKVANLNIGVKTWFILDKDYDAVAHISPNLRLNYTPVKDALKLYAVVDGDYINNHYSKIAYENPFVDPMHDVQNSAEKLHLLGGIDGKFASKTNFKLSADYSLIDNQPLYYLHQYTYTTPLVNPNPILIDNDFKVMYDNMSLFKFNLEIFHTSSEKLEFSLSGNYYLYKLDEQKSAWNMPDWDATFSLSYNITEQLSVSTDIFLVGTRKALIIETPLRDTPVNSSTSIYKSYNLDTAIDLNVRGDYKLTQKFSVFSQLNNFGFQKYERWFGYPVQSFNFLAGISYAF